MMMLSYLPDDLESEILSRVSAKALVKLKTTCKRWYRLFRDTKFIEKNKKLGKAVRESLLLSSFKVYSISEDLHAIYNSCVKPSIKFTGKLSSAKFFVSKIFHCEGLILCCINGNAKLVVWNPCTGQKRRIQRRTFRWEDTYALGYVLNRESSSFSSCHSYKILRCSLYKNELNEMVSEFEIYDLSSDSWRVIDYHVKVLHGGVSLKGDTYWVSGDKKTGLFLMKFDFTAERFVRLSLPFQTSDFSNDATFLSVIRDEKLSVSHALSTDVTKIWVSNKIDEEGKQLSWRRDFGLVLFGKFDRVANVKSFLLDEENKVAVCCNVDTDDEDRTRIIIVGEDMYQQVYKGIKNPYKQLEPSVLTYVPSLVRIHKEFSP